MRSARIVKKLHKYWLFYGVIDASMLTYWRKLLFGSQPGQSFSIDAVHCKGLNEKLVSAMAKYGLKYRVAVANGSET